MHADGALRGFGHDAVVVADVDVFLCCCFRHACRWTERWKDFGDDVVVVDGVVSCAAVVVITHAGRRSVGKKMAMTLLLLLMLVLFLVLLLMSPRMQVDGALEGFWRSLRPAGPDLSKGWIATSFFMRRVSPTFFFFF